MKRGGKDLYYFFKTERKNKKNERNVALKEGGKKGAERGMLGVVGGMV